MMLTRAATRFANTEVVDLCSDEETAREEEEEEEAEEEEETFQRTVHLSGEDDARYAAVLNFCERLYQLGEDKRGEFTRAGIETIFDALLHEHSGVANPKTLQLIWRLLGTAFVRANNTCRRVTRDIENQTAKDTIKDQSELRDLRTELACLKQDEKAYNHDVRISRLQYRMAGKQKMIIGEARKVALLYGLLGPKQRTSSRKAKQGQMKRSRAGVRVENRVEPFLWG